MGVTVIRLATPDDAASIAGLLDGLGYTWPVETLEERLERLMDDPDKAVWVAEHPEGFVAGCQEAALDLRLAEGGFVEITSLVVDPSVQGKGVGRRLTAAAAEWGRARGARCIRVCCNVRRDGAHRFYEGRGFREIKRQRVFERPLAGAVEEG